MPTTMVECPVLVAVLVLAACVSAAPLHTLGGEVRALQEVQDVNNPGNIDLEAYLNTSYEICNARLTASDTEIIELYARAEKLNVR